MQNFESLSNLNSFLNIMHFNAAICKIVHLGTQKVGHTHRHKCFLESLCL